ncbi:MAG: hypothetical protein EX271_00415 [Acidimicrobiales bacterium]|nr:hypothetical protein [Hyphomonadaceae bacterium]RZV44955.1 MAG: hypothetical protein EX271_00415 [Acidimicrobiales bacterium]
MDIFKNWTDDHTKKFRKDIITVKHRLSETGLFTDEALARLLNKHPSQKLDVCTMGKGTELFPNKFRTGDFRDSDGKTLIEAAKAGKIWINVREAMNVHPEYKAVLDQMYGAISDITGEPTFNARGGILISSPAARVPYHCDQTETILWHVRGKKRMYLYPPTEEYLPDEAYHRIITNDREDDIPYSEDMDKGAKAFDLSEDEMISWRLNAPHRVDNQSYCVSVTTEYSTKESAFKNSVMFTNAVLRQKFGVDSRWADASMPEKYVKSIAGRVLRKIGAYDNPDSDDMVTFKVDKNAPGFIVDVEPYQRAF